MDPTCGHSRIGSVPWVPQSPELVSPESHQTLCVCTCMVAQSREVSTKKNWAIMVAISCQATLLESGPGQRPQNDPTDRSPGALWGIWLIPHGVSGVKIKEHSEREKWEPEFTRILILGSCPDNPVTPVIPRYLSGTLKMLRNQSMRGPEGTGPGTNTLGSKGCADVNEDQWHLLTTWRVVEKSKTQGS